MPEKKIIREIEKVKFFSFVERSYCENASFDASDTKSFVPGIGSPGPGFVKSHFAKIYAKDIFLKI